MKTKKGKRSDAGWVSAALVMTPFLSMATAGAANLAYELSAGAGHSDNIARTPDNEIGEDIATAGLQFSLDQVSSRLEADLLGNFAYYEYLDETFDSEVIGNFAGNALFNIVQDRFQWVIADNFGQVLTDPFAPATPENRENINYLTTGPNIYFGFGSNTRLRLGGRYSKTTYEDSPFDSDSVLAEVELARALSSASSVSLNARSQQVEYDEVLLGADYDQSEAFLRYDASGARTFLTLDAGYTEIDRDASDSESGALFRLDLSRRVSASSIASLSLGHEFSSSGAAFASTQGGAGVGLGAAPGRQTADPFTNEYVTLGWSYQRNRTGFDLFATRSDQSYEGQPLQDQTLTSLTAGIDRDLSTTMSLGLRGSFVQGEFEQPNTDYDEVMAGATFSWRLSGHLSLELTYDYFDRSGDLATSDYKENRYWLSFVYAKGQPRARARQPAFAIDAAASEPAQP